MRPRTNDLVMRLVLDEEVKSEAMKGNRSTDKANTSSKGIFPSF